MNDTNSRVLLDSSAAADLAPRPGRAIWQWDRQVEVQLPMLEKREARALLEQRYGAVEEGRGPSEPAELVDQSIVVTSQARDVA